jgi:hypothetical protein
MIGSVELDNGPISALPLKADMCVANSDVR